MDLKYVDDNLSLMSVGLLLSSPDDAVIWRGPKKNGLMFLIFLISMFLLYIGYILWVINYSLNDRFNQAVSE